eukprot:4762405-Pyramimonas_sp.AAC.1
MITARALPAAPRPTTRPNPDVKRRDKLKEAKQNKMEQLEGHLREAYQELHNENATSAEGVAFSISRHYA